MRESSNKLPIFIWVTIQFAVAVTAFWLIALSTSGSAIQVLAIAVFVSLMLVVSLGALWMMWAATRHKNPVPKLLLAAFVPYSFVWYYFERANNIEIHHFKRVIRIGLTAVAIFTGAVFITRGRMASFIAIPLMFLCLYLSYLASQRERFSDR